MSHFNSKKFLLLAPWILPIILVLPYVFIVSNFKGILWVWQSFYAPFWVSLGCLVLLSAIASVFLWFLNDIGSMIYAAGAVLAVGHGAFLAIIEKRHLVLILVFVLFVAAVAIGEQIKKILLKPYFHSRRGWWESYPKSIPGLKAVIVGKDGKDKDLRLSNFGSEGCFVFSSDGSIGFSPESVKIYSDKELLFETDIEIAQKTRDGFGLGLKFTGGTTEGDWSKDLQDQLGYLRRAGYEIG